MKGSIAIPLATGLLALTACGQGDGKPGDKLERADDNRTDTLDAAADNLEAQADNLHDDGDSREQAADAGDPATGRNAADQAKLANSL